MQTRQEQAETTSRWREDKACAITSYLPGDGTPEHPPKPLVTTYVAAMGDTQAFGRLVRLEAETVG